jgi:predicted AAA+ superfamily ATPase
MLVRPFYENFGKRLIKSPKVYFVDSGLVCHLLGIGSQAELKKSPFFGALFEGFVASELAKQQVNRGERVELYYFRDQQGLEVDFIVPRASARLALVEAKASTTVTPAMAQSVGRLAVAITGYRSSSFVVHSGAEPHAAGRALSPGVEAVTLPELLAELA